MAGKGLPNFPDQIRSGLVGNATAITVGQALIYTNPTTDLEKVQRAAADNAANFAGIAYMAGAGADTEITYIREGDVMAKASGVVTANDPLVTAANGGVKVAAAGNKNIIGFANTSAADGDIFSIAVQRLAGIPT